MAKVKDQYDQFLRMNVTMSAANTLTFSELSLGVSIFEYAAMLISRIEYTPGAASWAQMVTTTDQMHIAVTGSDSIADISTERTEVYDRVTYFITDHGTAASATLETFPTVHDFTTLTGGGLLVPAQDMYLAMETAGFVSAGASSVRVYFTIKALEASDFIELAQRMRVLST